MIENLISIVDFACEHGTRKQSIFKIVKRLEIEPVKQRSSTSRGQLISYITAEDGSRILEYLRRSAVTDNSVSDAPFYGGEDQRCVFYLMLLEPNHDPGRFKVGIADNLPERLRHLRCSAPMIKLVNTWPCKRLWEKTAIDCVTEGCEKLYTEVFRTGCVESVVEKCERFFELMPKLTQSLEVVNSPPSVLAAEVG